MNAKSYIAENKQRAINETATAFPQHAGAINRIFSEYNAFVADHIANRRGLLEENDPRSLVERLRAECGDEVAKSYDDEIMRSFGNYAKAIA